MPMSFHVKQHQVHETASKRFATHISKSGQHNILFLMRSDAAVAKIAGQPYSSTPFY